VSHARWSWVLADIRRRLKREEDDREALQETVRERTKQLRAYQSKVSNLFQRQNCRLTTIERESEGTQKPKRTIGTRK
jgi:hypothetical protein